ncbi:MAG: complex I NDUFA9 subunit family protein [Rhodospirillaceae bacterium]|nr:MAG: complex I NDUFA9 subunit family protein [Rhodospirillaceae bacterium]
MAGKLVTVFGGSGFIGRHVVRQFAAAGWRVRIAERDTRKALFLKTAGDLGQISFIPASIMNDADVAAAVAGADAVINLVGVLYQRGRRSFQALHVDGAARVAKAATTAGVTHLVHLSALGASATSASAYARSKAAGEAAVQDAFPMAVILRPSVVFGPEDGFFNMFGALAVVSPILPFFTDIVPHADGGGGPRFQPVYVGDVAAAVLGAVTELGHCAEVYELGGPRVYDMRGIMNIVNRETMRRRWVCGIPFFIAEIKAFFLQFMPKPLLTPDQIKLLKQGNVLSGQAPGLEAFGLVPTAVEGIVGNYLKRFRPLQQNKRLRFAGRG